MSVFIRAWRIAADTPDYLSDDLSGKGAELNGGRWNHKGTPVVYASSSIALACLESVVNLESGLPLPLNRYLIQIRIPIAAFRVAVKLDPTKHVGWEARPAGKVSLDWGTNWVSSKKTLVALVPSVVVPEERNVLVNPLHKDIGSVQVEKMRLWTYDHRLG